MIRLINPILHTKYLDARAIRSACLWWTERPTLDKNKVFLQFETWRADEKGAAAHFDTVWKYPCFHLALGDMKQILTQAPWITHHVCQYQLEPPRVLGMDGLRDVQQMGDAPPSTRAAFAALNGLLPKNPL